MPAPCRAFHKHKLTSASPRTQWPRVTIISFWQMRKQRLRLRNLSKMTQAVLGLERGFPGSRAQALTLQAGLTPPNWLSPSGHRQGYWGPGGDPLAPGFLLCQATPLEALETGGLSLRQGTLETTMVHPPLGKKPRIKVQSTLSSAQVASFCWY